jgi:hypothetical protein
MCSHYEGEKGCAKLAWMAVQLSLDWGPPPGSVHIYPIQVAPIIRRPPERDSGDEAVPDIELVEGHFGLLPRVCSSQDIWGANKTLVFSSLQ